MIRIPPQSGMGLTGFLDWGFRVGGAFYAVRILRPCTQVQPQRCASSRHQRKGAYTLI